MNEKLKKAHKSKTMHFALWVAMLGVVESQFSIIEHYIPQEHRGLVFLGISLVMAWLRFNTTKGLDEK